MSAVTGEYQHPADADVEQADLRPLREHRAFISVFILSAMLSALVLTYIYSERYRAETTIFFKPSDVTRLGTHSTMALGAPLPTLPYKVVTQTITGLMDSDQLLRRVVTDLHLDAEEPKDFSGPWYIRYYKELKDFLADCASDLWKIVRFGRIINEDPVNKAITDLRKQIKVRNEDSYVYTVQVTGKTPQRAVAVADELGAALIDLIHRDDQRAATGEIKKLATLRDDKIEEIKGLETRMRDLLAGVQIASIKEEIDKLTALSSQLQQERSNTTADLRQSEAKLAALGEKLRLPSAPVALAEGDGAATRRPKPDRCRRLRKADYREARGRNQYRLAPRPARFGRSIRRRGDTSLGGAEPNPGGTRFDVGPTDERQARLWRVDGCISGVGDTDDERSERTAHPG